MYKHPTTLTWHAAPGKVFHLPTPKILGIINTTPDSFYDGGTLPTPRSAAERAAGMLAAGAIGIDLGGESTRPGAEPVPDHEQLARVIPAITAIRQALGHAPLITIDTTRAAVADAAFDAGADAVNDVSAGTESPEMFALCARRDRGIILMHRLRPPSADQYSTNYTADATPRYDDVVHDVGHYLTQRALAAVQAGIPANAIILDPGLGFGKTVAQNLKLIERTDELAKLGYPILSGISRKSFVGAYMRLPPGHTPAARLPASISLSLLHACQGARLLRVHDVSEHANMLDLLTFN